MMVLIRIGVMALMVLFLMVDFGFCQNTADQIWTKGVEYAAQGNFNDAKKEFEKVLKVDPSYESAKRFLIVIKDVNEKKIQSKTVIIYFKGRNFTDKKQFTEAIAEYNKAISNKPEDSCGLHQSGDCLSKQRPG